MPSHSAFVALLAVVSASSALPGPPSPGSALLPNSGEPNLDRRDATAHSTKILSTDDGGKNLTASIEAPMASLRIHTSPLTVRPVDETTQSPSADVDLEEKVLEEWEGILDRLGGQTVPPADAHVRHGAGAVTAPVAAPTDSVVSGVQDIWDEVLGSRQKRRFHGEGTHVQLGSRGPQTDDVSSVTPSKWVLLSRIANGEVLL